jgi:hypothetical protein
MFIETVKSPSLRFSLLDAENERQTELAESIHHHFCALAEMLGRAADLCGDTAEGQRLRSAATAASRGKRSSEKLVAKLSCHSGALEFGTHLRRARVP